MSPPSVVVPPVDMGPSPVVVDMATPSVVDIATPSVVLSCLDLGQPRAEQAKARTRTREKILWEAISIGLS